MNLAKLFGSKCRAKILERFLIDHAVSPDSAEFFIRELCRDLGEQLNSVRRELLNLEELGILKSEERQKKKLYRLNADSPLLPPLVEIFRATYDPLERLGGYLSKEKGIDLVTWGTYLRSIDFTPGQSVVDVFIIGDIDRIAFNNNLERIFFGRRIRYAIMAKDDFLARLEYHDKLVTSILRQKGFARFIDRLNIDLPA